MNDTSSRLSIGNLLLSAVPEAQLSVLRPYLELISFRPGMVLAEPGDNIRYCYFPNKGMISLLSVTEQGSAIEVAYAGQEGMAGVAAVLGGNDVVHQMLVQAETDCLVVDAVAVRELFRQSGIFHDLLLRYSSALLKQTSQTCLCNHFHRIEARLCRWLTVMCERSSRRHLVLTQEFLAHMLGVQRTSIGLIAQTMQTKGVIRYSRGRIEVIDETRLRDGACECYWIVQKEHENLCQFYEQRSKRR